MQKKPEQDAQPKWRSLTLSQETYDELEELRRREQEELGLSELSWNNFFARLAKKLKDERK